MSVFRFGRKIPKRILFPLCRLVIHSRPVGYLHSAPPVPREFPLLSSLLAYARLFVPSSYSTLFSLAELAIESGAKIKVVWLLFTFLAFLWSWFWPVDRYGTKYI
jgi:hypothetical protein